MDIVAAIALGRIGDVRAMLATNPRLIRKCAPEGGWTTLHIGAAHADAEKATQERLDAPGSVAEEVERELARRDEATKREQREAEFGQVKETVAKLTEKRPM